MLEGNAADAKTVLRWLLKKNLDCEFSLAMDKDAYLLALEEFHPTIILANHSLPQFTSEEAFAIARQRLPDIPFIIVTESVSEEYAADMIKMGVDDYILKDKVERLPDAMVIAIQRRKAEREKKQTELIILKSESNLREIFENTSEGFLLLDKDAMVIAFNSRAAKYNLFGKVKEFQIGQSIYDFIEESRKEFFREIIAKALEGEDIQYEHSYEMENGYTTWVDFSVKVVIEADQVKGICITGRDITEKKVIEQEREFDQNNLKALINNTNDLMWSVDLNLKLITSNEAFDKMVKAMSGKTITKGSDVLDSGFSKEQLDRFRKYYKRAFSGESFTEVEFADLPGDAWSEISFYPIYNDAAIIGAACFSRNLTQGKSGKRDN